ncbi:MAG: arylsulfatase [Sedimentisphaerales bacterium]|nr:arylsulfatase [Sedimentisphaerales bacterium]
MSTTEFTRRDFLKAAGVGVAVCSVPVRACPELVERASEGTPHGVTTNRPNIVLIMADDMGFSDIGCYGGEINTPNINKLATGGLRFTHFYNNSICVPTRASLLSGLYSQQVGVYGNSPRVMKNCVTLAEVLKSAGYRTLMTGKWHAQEIPVQRGFDRYFGLTDGCCNFWNPGPRRPGEPEPGRKKTDYGYPRGWAIDDKVYKPYAPKDLNFYTTDAFTDYALKYLDEYAGEDKPFFLYVGYTAPHYPLHAWPEDIAKYRGKYLIGWDKLRRQRYERQIDMGLFERHWKMSPRDEDVPKWDDVSDKDAWDLNMAVYAAMIDRMDQNIGRILAKIRQRGEEDNTLVLFLSDNGGCAGKANYTPDIPPGPVESYRSVDPPWANASNTPFRKFKVWDHEGGISTPLIAYWPSVIKKGGQITHQVGHIIDVMATFVDIAEADYPSLYKGRDILPAEGKSLLPILQGKQRAGHEAIFWQINKNSGGRAVRTDQWKLVKADPKKPWELYDMQADRTELNNLADTYPDKAKELSKLYDGWVKRCHLPA